MLTLFIFSLLTTIAIPSISTVVTNFEVAYIREQLAHQILLAQQVAKSQEKEVTVHFTSDQITWGTEEQEQQVWKLDPDYQLESNYPKGILQFHNTGQSLGGTVRIFHQGELVTTLQVQVASGRVTWKENNVP